MSKFEDQLKALADQGVDEETLNALRDASPLRAEKEEAIAKAAAAQAKAEKAEAALLKNLFEKNKATVKPEFVRYPDELDRSDMTAVEEWGREAGIFAPLPPETPAEEQAAHSAIDAAVAGGNPAPPDDFFAGLAGTGTFEDTLAYLKAQGRLVVQ